MTRPLRLEHPSAIWHVTARGNERRDIVRSDRDRRRFIELLGESVTLNRWELHAWVLMSNHYHLLVETPEPTLSRGIKRLNESHAQSFNSAHARVGHLFQSRFKSVLVERESHLLELIRYVVLNPVRAGIVEYPGDYFWSSYSATAGLGPAPPWLNIDWTLAQFGQGARAERHERYRAFVADGRGASYKPWERLIGQLYLGSSVFCDRMQELVGIRRNEREYRMKDRLAIRPSFDSIVNAVANEFAVQPASIQRRSHCSARKVLAQLAWREGGLSLAAIGQWMGLSGQGVNHLVRRGDDLERTDPAFAASIATIRVRLSKIGAETATPGEAQGTADAVLLLEPNT